MFISNKLPNWLYITLNTINKFLCYHKYCDCGTKHTFGGKKMDSNGNLAYSIQMRVCRKCGKVKYISRD